MEKVLAAVFLKRAFRDKEFFKLLFGGEGGVQESGKSASFFEGGDLWGSRIGKDLHGFADRSGFGQGGGDRYRARNGLLLKDV